MKRKHNASITQAQHKHSTSIEQEEMKMINPFTLFDIQLLKKSFDNASIANDCLPHLLNSYTFDSVYETDDDSLVFDAGGENRIELEFFDFNNPLKRSCSIMYWENGRPVIMNL